MVFATFFPPLLLSKILRGPSTTSERHMKIGSSGVRVKAQKRKHEHKGGRRNFSALGCIIWIPYSFLSLVTVIPSLKHYFKQVFQCFFLLCLQRKSLAFYSAAKVLYALTIIKLDWNALLFLSTQTDKSSTPYNKCLIRGVGWFFWMSHY